MARVRTLITHNNPPGVRRNPDDEYETSEYQMLADRRIVDVVSYTNTVPEEAKEEPAANTPEEVVEPPPTANKQMDSESKDESQSKPGGKKYKRRDMTAEG